MTSFTNLPHMITTEKLLTDVSIQSSVISCNAEKKHTNLNFFCRDKNLEKLINHTHKMPVKNLQITKTVKLFTKADIKVNTVEKSKQTRMTSLRPCVSPRYPQK